MIRTLIPFLLLLGAAASAQNMCFVDQNLDGFFDQPNETGVCAGGLCPIDKTACTGGEPIPGLVCPDPDPIYNGCSEPTQNCYYKVPCYFAYTGDCFNPTFDIEVRACIPDPDPPVGPAVCPLPGGGPCTHDGTGLYCSALTCEDVGGAGGIVDQSRPRVYTQEDGADDPGGACLDQIRFFEGFAMDCRPSGLITGFQNCCQDRGKIITDSQGGEGQEPGSVSAAPVLFGALGAAHAAFSGGASPADAAAIGSNLIGVGLDPSSISDAAAVTLITELLGFGCDAQDMETGVLKGSGMCHLVGDYCAFNTPFGCVQKKRAHCCFNSTLARIIHEQGRPQLTAFAGLESGGWGTPEAPQCRGLSPEEFQSLDFGQMDLSEYYTELSTRAAAEMQVIMQTEVDEYADDNGI
ncbi:MAG: conjugal transfer protein TraN [Pseudomonadota bacterium]